MEKKFAFRIRNFNTNGANLNALAGLDCFAGVASLSITREYLEEMEKLFEAYLREAPPAS